MTLSIFWAELTYDEAGSLRGATAFLPVGATEAHGPHLPLSTDVVIATESACRAARTLRERGELATVLPPVAYAVTEFASPFAGTISISKEVATLLFRDIFRGAAKAGIAKIVVCNAHLEPGNIVSIREAMSLMKDEVTVLFPDITRRANAARLGEEFISGACHAGRYESSLVLAAEPSLVREEIRGTLPANEQSLSVAIREGKRDFLEAGGDSAYFGFPADASAEEGHLLHDELARIYVEVLGG